MNDIKWEGAGVKLPDGRLIIETLDNGLGVSGWALVPTGRKKPYKNLIHWLDRSRCLNASTRHAPIIPTTQQIDGGEVEQIAGTKTDTPTILFLSRLLHWTIEDEVRGHFYNVR